VFSRLAPRPTKSDIYDSPAWDKTYPKRSGLGTSLENTLVLMSLFIKPKGASQELSPSNYIKSSKTFAVLFYTKLFLSKQL
jgi:hypothetical protein